MSLDEMKNKLILFGYTESDATRLAYEYIALCEKYKLPRSEEIRGNGFLMMCTGDENYLDRSEPNISTKSTKSPSGEVR